MRETGFRIWDFENPDHFPDSSEAYSKNFLKMRDFFLLFHSYFFIIFEFSSFQRKYSYVTF